MSGTASWLALVLDQEMIEVAKSGYIASRSTPDHLLSRKTGKEVANELGYRYLIRYLLPAQVGKFTQGTANRQYVDSDTNSASRYCFLPCVTSSKTTQEFCFIIKTVGDQ